MGKQRERNGHSDRSNTLTVKRPSTDFKTHTNRCTHGSRHGDLSKMAVPSIKISRGSSVHLKCKYQRPHRHKCRHHQQQQQGTSGRAANTRLHSSTSGRRSYSPVIQIRRRQPNSWTDGESRRSDRRRHASWNNDNNNNRVLQHAERRHKHRALSSNSHSNSNSNSNYRDMKCKRLQGNREEGRIRNSHDNGTMPSTSPRMNFNNSSPPLPPNSPPPPPPTPQEFSPCTDPMRRENEVTYKNSRGSGDSRESEPKHLDSRGEKHSDSSSRFSSTSKRRREQEESPKFTSYKWVQNVLEIPEVYRINFGFPDESQIGNCPIALRFWYDEKHSDQFKYYIRLYDDSGEWIGKKYVLKEQVGLALPQTYELKISEIVEKISNCPHDKRVWLDIRDFDLFSERKSGPLQPILSQISHLSFGGRLYRFSSTMASSFGEVEGTAFYYFVCNNLENLEYLCIDDEMLWKLSSHVLPPEIRNKRLQKLETLRLLSTTAASYASGKMKIKMTGCYVMRILRVAPNIKRLYGISMAILRDLEGENSESYPYSPVCLHGLIRSLTLKPEPTPLVKENFETYFLHCLSLLHQGRSPNWHHLEELDTRTFFYIKTHVQVQCISVMSHILDLNKHTVQKVILKPIRVRFSHLKFPILPQCTTIQFEVLRNFSNIGSYFGAGTNFKDIFPNLHSVEIWSSGLETGHVPARASTNEQTLFNRHFSEWAFEARLTLHRVKSLTLFRYCPTASAHNMAYLFKNITVLQLDNTLTDVAQFLPFCFDEWPKLQQLILKINTDTRMGDFDEAFTGIKRDKLKLLNEPPLQELLSKIDVTDPETSERVHDIIEAYRTNLAISQLKDLHLLKLVLRSGAMLRVPAFTKLSVMYGFGRGIMPKLAVQIGFHHRVTSDDKLRMINALTPILPYVALER